MDSQVEYPAWKRRSLSGRSELDPADLTESASIDELEILSCQIGSTASLLSRFYNLQRLSIGNSTFQGKLKLYKFRKLNTLEVATSLEELDFRRVHRIQHLMIHNEKVVREVQLHIPYLEAFNSSFELANLVPRGLSERRASFVDCFVEGSAPLGDRGLSSLTLQNCTFPDWRCLTKLRYVHVLKIRDGVDVPLSLLPHIRGLRLLNLPSEYQGRPISGLSVPVVYGKRMRS